MKHYLLRSTTSKVFLGVMAALLLYALTGFALAPYLLERYVTRYAQEQLGSRATIADVRFNPFLLRLEVKGFHLEYPPGQPILGFGRLLVDFQLSSLLRRAWTFADVQIDGLDLNVEVQCLKGGIKLLRANHRSPLPLKLLERGSKLAEISTVGALVRRRLSPDFP